MTTHPISRRRQKLLRWQDAAAKRARADGLAVENHCREPWGHRDMYYRIAAAERRTIHDTDPDVWTSAESRR